MKKNRINLSNKMGIEEVRNQLSSQALVTLAKAARVSEFHGGIIVPQDIAAVLAAGIFRVAFGDREESRKAVEAFIDWGRYEAHSPNNNLSDNHGRILNTDVRISQSTRDLIARARMDSLAGGKAHAGNFNLLVTLLGVNGGEPVEPLSFMRGGSSSPLINREEIYARAAGITPRGYGSTIEHALAQQTIARNLALRRAA